MKEKHELKETKWILLTAYIESLEPGTEADPYTEQLSTDDLIERLSDTIEVSQKDMNDALVRAGFAPTIISGRLRWLIRTKGKHEAPDAIDNIDNDFR